MKINEHLFSEIYGCYFTVVRRILERAEDGLTRAEIETMVQTDGFYDTAFHLLPKLFSGEWNLMEQKLDGKYYAKLLVKDLTRPMTDLEKAWLKALLSDKRMLLFLTSEELTAVTEALKEVVPLFQQSDFHLYDSALDGDPYEKASYIDNFRVILKACADQSPLCIQYESGKQNTDSKLVLPYKLSYSPRDDKFRLLGVLLIKNGTYKKITLNLARILSAQTASVAIPKEFQLSKYFQETLCLEPIVLEISRERNGLERCMLQFASWEKQTEYDEERDCYICRLYYDGQDETELLIRVLSFGPVIKVLGPVNFLNQIKERVRKQYQLNL